MANDDFLNEYRQFFQYFDETLDPNDQLPVKLASYKLFQKEVVGAIFNWTNQYLSDKKCPWHLISFLSRIVIDKTRKRCKKQPVQCGFNPSENAYEPFKLMHIVIEIINEVCFNYKSSLSVQNRQNMAVSFPLPAPEDIYNVVSTSALKNSRRKMEDRSIVIHDLNTIFIKQDATPSHYYAVFDGHDGDLAAVYGATHLHQYLAESTNFITDPEQAIRDAFCKTDSNFIKKCETDNIVGGTTAVCALLLPKEKTLYVAWAGDSQAVLVSRGKVLPCVVPHRPEREDERERIVKDGGMVLHWGVWRVNGQLSVSRAIGDADYKPYVTAIPEIVKLALNDEEDFIVLASDGLWDYVSDIDVATIVYDAVYNDPEKAKTCARDLVQTAKQCGSGDNISVIVVFLRDPYQIAEGPRWNNRLVSMDTLNNANIPFDMPNKTNNVDSLTAEEGMLLNFAEGLKKNDDLPNNDLIKMLEKSNSDRLSPSDFDKEDNLGPETNVDNPDDGPVVMGSPNFDTLKRHSSEALNNNQNCNNPFNDIEKTLELNLNLKEGTFEGLTSPTEEECEPTVNSVHNVPQLIDAGAESDSEEEEEWNYVSGEEANKENNPKPLQLSSKVAEEEEEDLENAMSQLNPNAAEFIPSPARAVASPLGRLLDEDQVLSRSPKKPPPTEVDINLPNLCDFEKDISLKPGETEENFSNGHQDGFNNDTNAINALNSRLDEFHFGRNAVPFTPVKLLDQSEASSTRANFGDESELTLGTSFNDSVVSQDQSDFVQKDDPMSMSFHQDRSDDLFDLNKVHVLPEDVDEFIAREDNTNPLFDDTISDLTEHYPLGNSEEKPQQNENEFTTDLDHEDNKIEHLDIKQSSTPNEERSKSPADLISPLEEDRSVTPREELKTPSSVGECELPKVEEHLATTQVEEHLATMQIEEDNRLNKSHSPFENDHLTSPVEEQKSVSPYEEKELYSNHEEKDICSPVEEKDVCFLMGKQNEPQKEEKEVFEEKDLLSEKEEKLMEDKHSEEDKEPAMEKEVTEEKAVFEEERIPSPEQRSVVLSPVEVVASPVSDRDLTSPVQDVQISCLQEERELLEGIAPMEAAISPKPEEIVREVTPDLERQIVSPVQEATSPVITDRENISPIQEDEITSLSQEVEMNSFSQEECLLVDKVESPLLEQDVSTAEIKEDDVVVVHQTESLSELESFKVTTTCDKLESPLQEEVPVPSETSQNIEEFLRTETVKSDEDTAKEQLENVMQLDNLNAVSSPEEKCVSPAFEVLETESQIPGSFNETSGESAKNQLEQSQISPVKEETVSFSSVEQTEVPLSLDIDPSNVDLHSQPTPEADKILIDVSDVQGSLNKSAVEMSSINTEDINSFLNRSKLVEMESPLSPNKSADIINQVEIEDISSPVRDQQPDLFKLTSSTPVGNKLETSEASPVLPVVDDKALKAKEEDKKPAPKSKPTTATAPKKTPSARTSLAPSKPTTKPSPKPATKTIPKTNSTTSKVNSITKTETAAPKMASKSSTSAAPKPSGTTTARIPLSARTKLAPKTNETNGTARPASKPSTGAIKKTTEGSSTKSTTAASTARTATTARSTLASARSATTTTAQPKPRPTTLKSAPAKTVDAPKPTSARTTTTANRVPLTSRTTATKTSSLLANKDVKDAASKTLSKTRSVTDKQVKETTNKLTAASRTVTKTTSTVQSLSKTTTATKKTEVTGTKTATNRTTTSARAPIRRPTTDTTKTATTTKVGKPKQNGVAPVVTEKIIVNNSSSKESNSVSNTNGDQEFVKDSSPIDNKLITESAAN